MCLSICMPQFASILLATLYNNNNVTSVSLKSLEAELSGTSRHNDLCLYFLLHLWLTGVPGRLQMAFYLPQIAFKIWEYCCISTTIYLRKEKTKFPYIIWQNVNMAASGEINCTLSPIVPRNRYDWITDSQTVYLVFLEMRVFELIMFYTII